MRSFTVNFDHLPLSSFAFVRQNDALLDSHVLCGSMKPCMDCHGQCETDPDYKFQDWLFNLEEDPRESVNLIHDYPEVRGRCYLCRNGTFFCSCLEFKNPSVDRETDK